ncbi:MAG: hypothetical protein ACXVSE_12265 [Solirubrobacteraceae bacterium]
MLLDDREQVPQQPLLERRKLRIVDGALTVLGDDAVDAGTVGGQKGGEPIVGLVLERLAVAPRLTASIAAADCPAQAPARRFALFRYR